MANKSTGIIDWQAVSEVADLDEVVRFLPPEHVIEVLGFERALEVMGEARVIEAVGLQRLIEISGPEKVVNELLKLMPPEQIQELLQRRQQSANGDKGAE